MVLLPTHTPTLFATAVAEAAHRLKQGEVIVLPTETVYGLAANARDARAVERIFQIKGRPAHNPVIVHVASLAMAQACCRTWPPLADALAQAFWPGPLTLVLPKRAVIPDIVTAQGPTVAIRWPSHPLIQAVILECGFPLAAPSANPSNQLSPTHPRHVETMLGKDVGLIVDGGQCHVGIESTVLDLTCDPPRLLRPGMISQAALRAVTQKLRSGDIAGGDGTLRSPGQLPRHYAPRASLHVLDWRNDRDLEHQLHRRGLDPSRTHVLAHSSIPGLATLGRVAVVPHDPEAFARALYAELHACDLLGAETILVEAPPDSPAWEGIHDRLARACA